MGVSSLLYLAIVFFIIGLVFVEKIRVASMSTTTSRKRHA